MCVAHCKVLMLCIYMYIGTQQGPVMLTAKNLQCMRAILSLAHCHGSILGTAWHLVLTTLQVLSFCVISA